MSKSLKVCAILALAASMLTPVTVVEAGNIRSTAERRLRPGRGFWADGHPHAIRQNSWTLQRWYQNRHHHQHYGQQRHHSSQATVWHCR